MRLIPSSTGGKRLLALSRVLTKSASIGPSPKHHENHCTESRLRPVHTCVPNNANHRRCCVGPVLLSMSHRSQGKTRRYGLCLGIPGNAVILFTIASGRRCQDRAGSRSASRILYNNAR